MSKNNGSQPKTDETTMEGLMEAIASGDISAQELIDTLAESDLMEQTPADMAMSKFKKMAKKGKLPGGDDEEDAPKGGMGCPVPGAKRRPMGKGRPPMESEDDEPSLVIPDGALAINAFESLVDEACGLRHKKDKKKKSKKKMKDATESQKSDKKPILEFAAPERQDVIRWARGDEPKRIGEGKTPFWFDGDVMLSAGTPIARRDLEEKQAQVVHPKNLSAYTGRHAVLANHGLRYAGYDVEVVDTL